MEHAREKYELSEQLRGAFRHARETYRVSERHACRLLGQWRGTQRYEVIYRTDEDALTRAIITLASKYGRYGYRRNHGAVADGWLAGRQGSGTAHLAARGAECARKTNGAEKALAE